MADKKVSNLPYTKAAPDPDLGDLLNLHRKEIFLALNCHAVATVQSFDPETLTITATVNYQKTFFQRDSQGIYNPVLQDYPILADVPVIVLGGGNAHLTMPIQKGDQCLILFNDRDLDNWFKGALTGAVATSRMHSFSDGLALVGLHAMANPISNYSAERAELRNGDANVSVGPEKIKVINADTDLKTILDDLVDKIKAITTSGGQTVSVASQTQLDLVKIEIGELLES